MPAPIVPSAPSEPSTKVFPYQLPLDQQQALLASIPLPLYYPSVLALMGAVGFVGMMGGRAAPVEPETKALVGFATAAASAAAVAALGVQGKKKRDSAAVVALYNKIVDLPDPCDLSPELVNKVGADFGINMHKDDVEGLSKIYSQYLEAMIPSGEKQLNGDEAPSVLAFKNALGLSDEDAAPVHIEVARRLFRQGYETKDRAMQFEQRKAFQRLIYVSQIVFGEAKSAFLLPWRRLFNITDAQIFVARRDNARAIFRAYLEKEGGDLPADRHFLRQLRDQQQQIKMMDETAIEVVREASRKHVEGLLEKALTHVKASIKSRDATKVITPVQEAIEYSRKLTRYANEEDLIPGLGPVILAGGTLAVEGRARDLKDLYKLYVEERMARSAAFDTKIKEDAHDLQAMLGLNAAAVQALQDESAGRLYKKLLREQVTSGKLDAAESPAQVLGDMCDRVGFSPEAALDLHKGLYKAKLVTLTEGRTLTDANVAELARIRRILCLPVDVVRKVQRETSGKQLEEAISDIYMMGAKPVTDADMAGIDQVIKDMRIESEVALEVFTETTRERLRAYVQQAIKERGANQDRKASAAVLKKLVQFNAIVVTPMLERVKGTDAAKKEIAEIMAKAMEQAKAEGAEGPTIEAEIISGANKQEQVGAVQKAMAASRGAFDEEERRAQKEITLKEDVAPENRALLYKDFLMSTMSGDVVELPVGGTIRRKVSQSARTADMWRLQTLADLLGMGQAEISAVQGELAESAYKSQAQEVLRSGPLTEERVTYLEDLRNQLGLTKEMADKALKTVRTEMFGSQSAVEDGKWTIERIAEVTKAGGSVDGLVEESTRRNLFRREFERAIGDDQGTLDKQYMLHTLPAMLSLDERRIKSIIKELAGSRKRLLLVQAISQYRQRRPSEVTGSLLNLLSCCRVLPETSPMQWKEKEELRELFTAFCSKVEDDSKRTELGAILGMSTEEMVEATSASATAAGRAASEDESAFF